MINSNATNCLAGLSDPTLKPETYVSVMRGIGFRKYTNPFIADVIADLIVVASVVFHRYLWDPTSAAEEDGDDIGEGEDDRVDYQTVVNPLDGESKTGAGGHRGGGGSDAMAELDGSGGGAASAAGEAGLEGGAGGTTEAARAASREASVRAGGLRGTLFNFFHDLVPQSHAGRPGRSLAVPMTVTAIVALLVAFLGYSFFESDGIDTEGNVIESLQSNKISGGLTITIIVLVGFIVLDRVVYLRCMEHMGGDSPGDRSDALRDPSKDPASAVAGWGASTVARRINRWLLLKLIVHWVSVVLLHVVVFYVWRGSYWLQNVPKPFTDNHALSLFYVTAMAYLVLSGLQIRYGFPPVTSINAFTESTGTIGYLLFKVYRLTPFFQEIRATLDWTCCRTSLDLFHYWNLEDMHDLLFKNKCLARSRDLHKLGDAQKWYVKLGLGCGMTTGLIFLLIFPLFFFSSLNPTAGPNLVNTTQLAITVSVREGNSLVGHYDLFEDTSVIMGLQNKTQFQALVESGVPSSVSSDDENSVQTVMPTEYSEHIWQISPPTLEALREYLSNNTRTRVSLDVAFSFNRKAPSKYLTLRGDQAIALNGTQMAMLRDIIDATSPVTTMTLEKCYVPWYRLPATSPSWSAIRLDTDARESLRVKSCILGLKTTKEGIKYWTFTDMDEKAVQLHVVSDRVADLFGLDSALGYGIIAFYIIIIGSIGSLLRALTSGTAKTTMFLFIPKADALFDLCEAVYIARWQGKIQTEDALYWLLVEIFRSSELLRLHGGTRPFNLRIGDDGGGGGRGNGGGGAGGGGGGGEGDAPVDSKKNQ